MKKFCLFNYGIENGPDSCKVPNVMDLTLQQKNDIAEKIKNTNSFSPTEKLKIVELKLEKKYGD